MNVGTRPKVVLLGMMSNLPFAGVVWQTVHYLIGLRRLGYDPYYVEAHGSTPTKLMQGGDDDGIVRAAAFVAGVLQSFDFADRWGYHAPNAGNRYFGMTESQLGTLYREAAVIINLHGSTVTLPEHSATGRLVYLETDPVAVQVQLHENNAQTIKYLEPHCAFFTFGENYGRPGCRLPVSDRFHFQPTRQPVVMDFWKNSAPPGEVFTTVANWKQAGHDLTFEGETYYWSKHREFHKHLVLPSRTRQPFELALSMSSIDAPAIERLEKRGWRVTDALPISRDWDRYRDYIFQSRGEFTVAKDQNVRLKTGWFSDRSATYLAAGRPVITQNTAFDEILPTGEGLFAFLKTKEIVQAVARINADYARHSRAATAIAREYFSHDVVLGRLMSDIGVPVPAHRARGAASLLVPDLVIVPTSRWPTTLDASTVEAVTEAAVPAALPLTTPAARPRASIVIVTFNSLIFTKLCLDSVIANTEFPGYEVVVVDNWSTDGTVEYLRELAREHSHVTVVFNDSNRGFAAANNQGLARATGNVLVLLNNDTIVPPGWLSSLSRTLDDPAIGLAGPVTNRASNEAQVMTSYRTYGEMAAFAHQRAQEERGRLLDIGVLTMYCLAMRRDVFERIGPLDERFEIGMFEDDDYAMRAREAGYRVVCAEDTFVHHFGQASIGGVKGGFGSLFHQNRQRWEEKWGRTWQPHHHRRTDHDLVLAERIRTAVNAWLPEGAIVAVVTHGDVELVHFDGRIGWHFPQAEDGSYAGYHPANSREAIAQLNEVRARGAQFLVFPEPSMWWLSHYRRLAWHLERRFTVVDIPSSDCRVFAIGVRRKKLAAAGKG
jgi:GT2 family glycosyltransferase